MVPMPLMLRVIPISTVSNPRGMKPRCAGVIAGKVVPPIARVRIASTSVAYASTLLYISTLAQHALAADAASRRARSCPFQCPFLLQ